MDKQNTIKYIQNLVGKKAIDSDGVFGVQCVDIAKRYLQEAFNLIIWTTGNGMVVAKNVAKLFPNNFDIIAYYDGFKPQAGDVISYNSKSSPTCGHVGLVASDTDANGKYQLVEQWNGCGNIRLNTYSVLAPKYGVSYSIIAVARPKFSTDTAPILPTEYILPLKTVVKYNDTNRNNVIVLQATLNVYGYTLAIDGLFGPLTLKAVKDFQAKHGLEVDGIVGPKTITALSKK